VVPGVQHPQLRQEGQLLERAVLPFPGSHSWSILVVAELFGVVVAGRLVVGGRLVVLAGRLVVVVAGRLVVVLAGRLVVVMAAKLDAAPQEAAKQGPEAEVVQTLLL
jgi:hypothetical protein